MIPPDRIEAEGRAAARAFRDTFRTSDLSYPRHSCGGGLWSHCEGCGACFGQPHPVWCQGGICANCGHGEQDHTESEWSRSRDACTAKRRSGRPCPCRHFTSIESERAYREWCGSPDAHRAARAARLAMAATATEPAETFVQAFVECLGAAMATEDIRPSDFGEPPV